MLKAIWKCSVLLFDLNSGVLCNAFRLGEVLDLLHMVLVYECLCECCYTTMFRRTIGLFEIYKSKGHWLTETWNHSVWKGSQEVSSPNSCLQQQMIIGYSEPDLVAFFALGLTRSGEWLCNFWTLLQCLREEQVSHAQSDYFLLQFICCDSYSPAIHCSGSNFLRASLQVRGWGCC